jgi:hypothetical protein
METATGVTGKACCDISPAAGHVNADAAFPPAAARLVFSGDRYYIHAGRTSGCSARRVPNPAGGAETLKKEVIPCPI